MKYIEDYKLFENRNEAISLVDELKEGDCIVSNRDVSSDDIDFSKIAKTWWGRNISNIDSIAQKLGKSWDYSVEDQIVFISVGGRNGYQSSIYKEYYGYGESSEYIKFIDPRVHKLDEDYASIFGYLIKEGFFEIVSYDDLPSDSINEFETKVLLKRIEENNPVYVDISEDSIENGRVSKVTSRGNEVSIDVVDNKRRKGTYYYQLSEIRDLNFTYNGKPLDGYPFEN